MAQSTSLRSREEIMATGCVGHEMDLSVAPMCMNCEEVACVAEWGCLECSAPLCTACKVAHLKPKLSKNHRIVSLEDFGKRAVCKCAKHPDEEIKCVCDDCDVLVCCMGVALSHGGHKISALKEAITRERSKLKEASHTAEQLMVRVQPKVEQANERLVEYRKDAVTMHEQIDSESTQLVELILHRAAAAHEEVDSRVGETVRLAEADKDTLESWLSRTRSCLQSVGRVLNGNEGVAAFTTCKVRDLLIHLL